MASAQLTDINGLPDFDLTDPEFGEDVAQAAKQLFSEEHRGLWRTGDTGVAAYRNTDLRVLGNHEALSHQDFIYGQDGGGLADFMKVSTFSMQPPEHRPAKALISRQLMAKNLDRFMEPVDRIVDDLIATACEREQIDFVDDFTKPLVERFWGNALGFTREEATRVSEANKTFMRSFKFNPTDEDLRLADHAASEMMDVLTAVLEREQQTDSHQILVGLVEDFENMGEVGRPSNICAHLGAGISDGFGTLAGMVANVVQSLLEAPDSLVEVRADRSLVTSAWFEGSRLNPAVLGTQQGALEDFEYDGVLVPKGTVITLLWLYGNRDPEIWDNPQEYRLQRGHRTRQSTFGGGFYICPGRHLVRFMSELVIRHLTEPSVEVEATGDIGWSKGSWVHHPSCMPLRIGRN